MIRPANAEVLEEDLVEFVIPVLTGMNDDVVATGVEAGHHS
jgi:hypothetical protein